MNLFQCQMMAKLCVTSTGLVILKCETISHKNKHKLMCINYYYLNVFQKEKSIKFFPAVLKF